MTTLSGNCSERVVCESQAPWTSRITNVNGTDKVETSTMVIVEYICRTGVSPSSRAPTTSTINGNDTTVRFTNATETGLQTDTTAGQEFLTDSEVNTTAGQEPLTDSEETNTAAIVVPIVVVVLIIFVSAVLFLYWRRNRQKEKGDKGENQAQNIEQNPGYFDTDKVTQSLNDINNGDPAQENTYHYIDPNSVQDRKYAV